MSGIIDLICSNLEKEKKVEVKKPIDAPPPPPILKEKKPLIKTIAASKPIKKKQTIVKKPIQTSISQKIIVLDNQTLRNDPKNEYQ